MESHNTLDVFPLLSNSNSDLVKCLVLNYAVSPPEQDYEDFLLPFNCYTMHNASVNQVLDNVYGMGFPLDHMSPCLDD